MEYLIASLKTLNWLAVAVAAFVGFSLGAIWYSPVMFVKAWLKESKVDPDAAKHKNMALIFGTALSLQFIAAIFVGVVTREADLKMGLIRGSMIGIVWVATSMGIHYLFEGKSLKLFLINAGYSVVSFALMGLILGAWH